MNADFPASRAVCLALSLLCAPAMAEPEAAGKTADAGKEKDKKEEKEKKERVPSVIPSHLMQLAQKSTNTLLQWANGQSLDGELLSLENGVLTWKSPLFTDAMKLKAEALRRIDFNGKVSAPAGTFRFVLADGSHLTGDLTAATTDTLTLKSDRTGEIALRRDQVVRLERISGGALVRDASATPAVWSGSSQNSNGELSGSWYMAPGGMPATPSFNQTMYLKEKLPEKVEVELMLRTDERPDIALSLGAGSSAVRLETWENEIVLLEGSRFVPSTQKLTDQTRSLHLRLTWDRTAGKATLFSADGTVWCELNPEAKKPDEPAKPKEKKGGWLAGLRKKIIDDEPPEPSSTASPSAPEGVTLISRCPGLIVERLAVRSWNGNPLPALAAALPGVETDSGIIPGEVTSVQDGKFTIRAADGTEKQVPADEVRSIRRMEATFPKPAPETVELWYADGALLRGRITAARDGRVTVENPCVTAPVSAKIEGARSIRFTLPDKEEEAKLETLDTLSVGGRVLHGSLVFSGAALPAFQPTGALEATVPAAKEVILSRALPKDSVPKLSSAFLHLEGGQTIPAELHTVDRDRITFAAPGSEVKELPASAVHAVQFAPGELTGQSFSDPGWTATGKGVKRSKTQITLEAGGGVFHPLMSQGSELQFKMKTVDSMGSIRVRLFSQGADRPLKSSMNLLIADYGGTVYCGEEASEGQMNERGDINVKHGQPVTVKILLTGPEVALEINGQPAVRLSLEAGDKRRSGHGLVIESAGVWGQNPSSVRLSDFSVKLGAYQISAPFFTEEARKEALLLPRFRREDRPRHVLIGVNGDLLRGEIEGMTAEHIGFRSGMESFQVPRSRVTAAVWVLPPEKKAPDAKPSDKKEEPAAPPPDAQGLKLSGLLKKLGAKKSQKNDDPAAAGAPEKIEPDVWLSLTNGGQVALKGEKFAAAEVTGTHPLLGRMTIPSTLIQQVRTSAPGGNAASSALSSWRFELTPDPVIPGDGEGGDASPLAGKPAPDFKVPLLAGGDFTLNGAKGKVVVLDFWATWCGPCIQSLPGLMEEMAKFPEDKVVFLTLNQGESKDKVQKFLETRGWKMPVGMDGDTGVAKKYGVEGIPHTVVIGPDGKVIFVKTGFSSEGAKQIAEAVQKAMGGASPAPEKEKEEKPEPEKKPEPKKEEKADDPDVF